MLTAAILLALTGAWRKRRNGGTLYDMNTMSTGIDADELGHGRMIGNDSGIGDPTSPFGNESVLAGGSGRMMGYGHKAQWGSGPLPGFGDDGLPNRETGLGRGDSDLMMSYGHTAHWGTGPLPGTIGAGVPGTVGAGSFSNWGGPTMLAGEDGYSTSWGYDTDDGMMSALEGAINLDPYAIGQSLMPQVNDPMMEAFDAAASSDPYAIGQNLGL